LGNSQFLSIIAVFVAKQINKSMKQLNERKPIQQDLDRVSRYRKKYGAAEDKAELDAAFAELKSKAKNVSGDSLSDWDKESLKIATEYVRDENKEEFLKTINRILELAGLSPEMEKEIFQRQQILQKEIENKND
jgi:reverse gyrase